MSSKPPVIQAAPNDPEYLLDPTHYRERRYLDDKFVPFLAWAMPIAGCFLNNAIYSRPLKAGLPYFFGASLVTLALGVYYQQRSDLYNAERDAVYRHYYQLHREDFPAAERVMVKDLFKPWMPMR